MNIVSKIIDQLGGTSEVARLCDIKPPSVSEWKARNTIPKAQLKYLMLLRPDIDWAILRGTTAETAARDSGATGTLGEEAA